MLGLTEELFMLTLVEKRRSIAISRLPALPFALGGAILFELISYQRIKLEDGKKIALADYTLMDDRRLDEALDDILTLNRHKRITFWINELVKKTRKIQRSLIKSLLVKGALHEFENEYRWALPYPESSPMSGSAKFQLKNTLRNAVFAGEPLEPNTAALLSLLSTCNLLGVVFTEDEIKAAMTRVDEILNADSLDPQLAETLHALDIALDAVLPGAFK